jgi:hypothetical protein
MLLRRIERYLSRHEISPARFGIEAANDPRLVFDLRRGREPRRRMVERVEAYLARVEAEITRW